MRIGTILTSWLFPWCAAPPCSRSSGGARSCWSRRIRPLSAASGAAVSLVGLLIVGAAFLQGLASLVSGPRELPLLLFPVAFAAVWAVMVRRGPAMARDEISLLLDELNTILDSTATFPGA